MGACTGIFQSLNHITIYSSKPWRKCQIISISLENDVFKINPDFDSMMNTASQYANQEGKITLLKNEHGIKTSLVNLQKIIKMQLVKAEQYKIANISILQPNMNRQNRQTLFTHIVQAIFDFDKESSSLKYLKRIYIYWPGIENKTRQLYNKTIHNYTQLSSDQ